MKPNGPCRGIRHQRGLSLIELIVFIVIVSTGVAGVLSVLNLTATRSADPMTAKQALTLAETLLEEAQLMPFTYCDPDDANATTALNTAGCATTTETTMAAEAGETRGSLSTPFDNVNDYNGYTQSGTFADISGNSVISLPGYTATITVSGQALGTIGSSESLLIRVRVTGPNNVEVNLYGYRVRYAPNAVP